ncbi:SPOR domain-containing protein [Sphingomonas sp. ABOLD]|uniref:Rare lipoprotein A n=1 Tax=Sphingomonas trueperi TaxID=53317 RepID=A0A7X6BC83_9SPHN|nr:MULTISPECIES: SPOR domain-containing protein [Sphingomonas]NJB97278.1 rare lipoprotein A [Sphingomonas trueperi]RSV34351.1 SPOR domain-containing protein [Sphingomonas sp. ABOLE]RSV50615.1 SPOR domain-containing protein [Sphingomonas sp. ABOLD]
MQWNARPIALALALLAATSARAQDADPTPGASGRRGTSERQPGDGRYDAVGYAAVQPFGAAALAVSPNLPAESYAEVTALDSGRTILVRIAETSEVPGAVAALSEGAASQLGVPADRLAAVRIRAVRPSAEDQAALRSAGAAQPRIDSPPALLRALRLQLPPQPDIGEPLLPPPAQPDPIVDVIPHPVESVAPPAKPRSTPKVAPPKPGQGRYLVQVAALSSPERAQALAQKLRGFVKAGGGLYRVQLGPFATEAVAERARAEAVRAGFGDARRTTVR